MDVGICLPHYGRTMEPAGMRIFAETAETLGFDSIWVSDDVILPRDHPTPYRDNMLESLSTLSYLAAVTTEMRLGVSVCVLPYRHPVMTAKAVATADVLSGGRTIFGIGVGAAQPEEFEALDVRFQGRGSASDAYLRAIRSLWTHPDGDVVNDHVVIQGMHFSPQPVQRPHPPVWVGGRSVRAIRRAVELGDGWHPVYLSPRQLGRAVQYMGELAERRGRAVAPLVSLRLPVAFGLDPRGRGAACIAAGGDDDVLAKAEAYRGAGVEHLVLDLPDVTFTEAMEQMQRLAERVVARLR